MKHSISIALIALAFSISATARNESQGRKLVRDIEELALKCISHPYVVSGDGEKQFASFQNTCPQIEVIDSKNATVYVDNQVISVSLREAQDADGGDLNHMLLFDTSGKLIGQRLNVLAFNNIFLALIGGKSELVETEAK